MKLRRVMSKTVMIASWSCIPLILVAQTQQLSLKHGVYVLDGVACKEPPFAAMKTWDGVGFAGPHSSQCRTEVLSHHGNQFSVSTSCSALGDSAPDKSAYVGHLSFTQISKTRIVVGNTDKTASTYRWCGAK